MKLIWIFITLSLFLSACGATTYRTYNKGASSSETTSLLEREVRFDIRTVLYKDPPDCALVLPTLGAGSGALKAQVAQALARHISGKIQRVVSPLERHRLEKSDLLDPSHGGDRRRMAFKTGCRYFIQARLGKSDDSYMLVWSEKRIGISLKLFRAEDEKVAWRADHTARRGDGGLPLTPISLVSSAVVAGKMEADKWDTQASLIDDAMRRIFKSLPDMR